MFYTAESEQDRTKSLEIIEARELFFNKIQAVLFKTYPFLLEDTSYLAIIGNFLDTHGRDPLQTQLSEKPNEGDWFDGERCTDKNYIEEKASIVVKQKLPWLTVPPEQYKEAA